WYAPLALHPAKPKSSVLAAGVAFGLCALAISIVLLILYNAHRVSPAHWTVTDPRDQGGAVAGYLATYLLPLVDTGGGGWRVTTAYVIYFVTLYLVFIRSDTLVLINPTLYVLNFRIYDVELATRDPRDRRRVLLLTRKSLTTTTDVEAVPLGD